MADIIGQMTHINRNLPLPKEACRGQGQLYIIFTIIVKEQLCDIQEDKEVRQANS